MKMAVQEINIEKLSCLNLKFLTSLGSWVPKIRIVPHWETNNQNWSRGQFVGFSNCTDWSKSNFNDYKWIRRVDIIFLVWRYYCKDYWKQSIHVVGLVEPGCSSLVRLGWNHLTPLNLIQTLSAHNNTILTLTMTCHCCISKHFSLHLCRGK